MHKLRSLFSVIAIFILALGWIGLRGEFPINDDWTYYWPAWTFFQGDFHLHNYASLTVIAQSAIAALVGKLFGFTHESTRLLTAFLAVGTLSMLWFFAPKSARRSPLVAAVLIAVAFYPLFLLSSLSFMTDMYFAVYLVGALLFLVRFIDTRKKLHLALGTAFAVAATLTRQPGAIIGAAYAYLGMTRADDEKGRSVPLFTPLVASVGVGLIYEYWLFRTDRYGQLYNFPVVQRLEHVSSLHGVSPAGLQLLSSAIYYTTILAAPVVAALLERALRRVKLSKTVKPIFLGLIFITLISAIIIRRGSFPTRVVRGVQQAPAVWVYVSYFLTPFIPILIWRYRAGKKKINPRTLIPLILCGLAVVLACVILGADFGSIPLAIGNLYLGQATLGTNSLPTVPPPIWLVLRTVPVISLAVLSILLLVFLNDDRPIGTASREWDPANKFLVAFGVFYFGLISVTGIHDRYTLPLVLVAAALLLRTFMPAIAASARVNKFAQAWMWAFLCIASLLWTGLARDYMNWNRARWRMVDYALHRGIQPSELTAGYEFEGAYNNDPHRPVACAKASFGGYTCTVANKFSEADPARPRRFQISLGRVPGRTVISEEPVPWTFGGDGLISLSEK